jgi:hypothetical protein
MKLIGSRKCSKLEVKPFKSIEKNKSLMESKENVVEEKVRTT